MIRSQVFRRHFLITALVLVLFVIVGVFTSDYLVRATRPRRPNPPLFLARLVDHLNPGDRIKSLRQIEEWNAPDADPATARGGGEHPPAMRPTLMLIDAGGRVLFPPGAALPFAWATVAKPARPYETVLLEGHGPMGDSLVRLQGAPAQYLLQSFVGHHGPPRAMFFLMSFGFQAVWISLGAGLALLLLFRSLHKRARLADGVIAELQRGNLKARFPISRMDEIGEAMSRFNRMADEIERLVERVQSAEKARMTLLQELAHDLRTPVASMKNMLETLNTHEELEPKVRAEFLALSLREVEYFERLVEDLLILAQVSEPRYDLRREAVDLAELLEDEAEGVQAHYQSAGRAIELERAPAAADGLAALGDRHLLRRMLRNALDNAFSFARTRVRIAVAREPDGGARVLIEDDGPGFPAGVLDSYGTRRISRRLVDDQARGADRVSVGLGSVILRTVAQSHGGQVRASNVAANGGARVEIRLPAATARADVSPR